MSLRSRTQKIMAMAIANQNTAGDALEVWEPQDDTDDNDTEYIPSSVISSTGSFSEVDYTGFFNDYNSPGNNLISRHNNTNKAPESDPVMSYSKTECNRSSSPVYISKKGITTSNKETDYDLSPEISIVDDIKLNIKFSDNLKDRSEEYSIPYTENQIGRESNGLGEFHMSDSGPLPFSIPEYLNAKIATSKRNRRVWDKRDFCLYCYEDVTNFSRHLMRKHRSEIPVQQFINMPVGSIERKHFIDMLRKRGNFLSPAQKEIKLVKRPIQNVSPENILACMYCKGYYMKRYLRRHVLKCRQRPQDKSTEKFSTTDAQTYLAFRCVDDKFVSNLRLKEGVLNMRCDSISLIAKSDPLILSFASFYAKRHRHNHLNRVTKNKLRELARLWQNMKLYVEDKNMFEALKPENFKYFVLSTQNIAGYNEKTQEFEKAPSLALHMGTTLKKLCEHAFSEIQQKNMIFINGIDSANKAKEIKILRQLIRNNWNAEVSSVAHQNLVENQWKKPTIIPLTSDIQKLNNFVKEKAENCAEKLKEDNENRKAFSDLQKCCYALLITLNRRRVGELERLQLESYLQKNNDIISEEFQKNLSDAEKILLQKYKRIRIRGKRHKPVPVLISKEVQNYIELLMSVRKHFVPEENPYLFATVNRNTCLDGYSSLRNLALASGAEYPEVLTSGKLRKHIATISQIYNLNPSELEQLCSFLGHTVTTHQNFYRLPQEVYQTAKLAKHLLKSQNETVDIDDMNENLVSDDDDDSIQEINDRDTLDPDDDDEKNDSHNIVGNKTLEVRTLKNKLKKELKKSHQSFNEETTEGINEKPTVKHSKVRWTPEQKSLTITYFKNNIKNKKPPTQSEAEEFRQKNSTMANKDWKKIKAFIFNEYNKNK